MSTITEQFEAAQVAVKNLSEKPGNFDLLALYANFKQATDGDAGQGAHEATEQSEDHALADELADLRQNVKRDLLFENLLVINQDIKAINLQGTHVGSRSVTAHEFGHGHPNLARDKFGFFR